MEKYKLKKDTFFHEAGMVCRLTPKGNLVLDDNIGTCILNRKKLKEHPELLDEWFEKIEEEKKYGGRVPKEGNEYWFIDDHGRIHRDSWRKLTNVGELRFNSGFAFWTEEEAEKELARRKAYAVLKEDTKGFEPDWNDGGEPKYFVGYSWGKGLVVDYNWRYQWLEGLYFATEEDARISIKNHKQEWLDYLGVEEQ